MPLQTSGPIDLADIAAEFGGTAPHSLTEYYAGGPYVPAGTAGIPSSGPIDMTDFYGAAAGPPVASWTFRGLRERDDLVIYTPPSGEYGWSKVGRSLYETGWGTLRSGDSDFVYAVQLVAQEKSSGQRGVVVIVGGSTGFTLDLSWVGGSRSLDSKNAVMNGPISMYQGAIRVSGLYSFWFDLGTGAQFYKAWDGGDVSCQATRK